MENMMDIDSQAKTVSEALYTRHSIREFMSTPIPEAVLNELIQVSLRAPSWKNAQPWKVKIVSGKTKDNLALRLTDAARNSKPNPDTPWLETYPSNAKKRMFDLGMKVYEVAGIERKDKPAREEFMLRNFSFFGAPTAIIITTTFEMNFFIGIDLGCYLQSVLLLARQFGLGACPQAAVGAFPDVIKSELALPSDEKVVMGISIGYPIANSDLNRFHAPREEKDNLVQYYS